MGAPLQGPVQTVPRAELTALLYFLLLTVGDADIASDCAYVVNGFRDGRHFGLEHGDNADIWHAIGARLSRRQGTVTVRKVKGIHQHDRGDMDLLAAGRVSPADYYGSLFADRFADRAAAAGAVPDGDVDHLKALEKKLALVHRRIAYTSLVSLEARAAAQPQGPKRKGPKKSRSLSLAQLSARYIDLIAATGHNLVFAAGGRLLHSMLRKD